MFAHKLQVVPIAQTVPSDQGDSTVEPPTGGVTGEPPTGGVTGESPTGALSGEPPTGGVTGEPPTGAAAMNLRLEHRLGQRLTTHRWDRNHLGLKHLQRFSWPHSCHYHDGHRESER